MDYLLRKISKSSKQIICMGLILNLSHSFAEVIKLPPSPGKENEDSLLGIDYNNNLVRDDIEVYIYNQISKDPKIYLAYLKYAESQLAMLRSANDLEELKKLDIQISNDLACIGVYDDEKSISNISKLGKLFTNTDLRVKAFDELAKKHKHFTSKKKSVPISERSNKCRFKS